MKHFLITITLLLPGITYGQVSSVQQLEQKYLNWYNSDLQASSMVGTSVDRAYQDIISAKTEGKTIIVAVIDSGVDIEHEDLKGRIWINSDEIPGNQIDDDGNGYIDDIHGWNFIGNDSGENIYYENYEYTRITRQTDLGYYDYQRAKSMYEAELVNQEKEKKNLLRFEQVYNDAKSIIKTQTGVDVTSMQDLATVTSTDEKVLSAKRFLQGRYAAGLTEKGLSNIIKTNNEALDYFLNLDFDARSLVGDDPLNLEDKYYGNPDVKGPRSDHGTSVAGVIAAVRDNGLGIDGIATNVRIMALRSTPRGDERDKDVALSIMYAVDNGADIINMSFGKDFSPQKEFVDQAVKYAEDKGVLIIHGSGNSGKNIDETEAFPSDRYANGEEASNWLNVGASTLNLDDQIAAFFSNYGAEHVDIFAPGVNIISTDSSSTYSMHDGTSLSAPVVSGIAALVLSHYPTLEPHELIDILMTSSFKFQKPKKVLAPTSNRSEKRSKVKFSALSRSGGIANAYNALMEAEKRRK